MENEKINKFKGDIQWFYENRDIERYASLDEALEYLPELKMAFQNYLIAKMALDKAVQNLSVNN